MNLLSALLLLQWAVAPHSNGRAFTPPITSSHAGYNYAANVSPKIAARALPVADSATTRKRAEKKVDEFLEDWKHAWMKSDETRTLKDSKRAAPQIRSYYAHCHPDPSAVRSFGITIPIEAGYTQIPRNYEALNWNFRFFAKCATWMLGPIMGEGDEGERIDNAILPQLQKQIAKQRAELNTELDAAQRQLPRDPWIAGQTVRFLIDAGKATDAIRASKRCLSGTWWCSAITGYALYRANDMVGADSAFDVATSALQGNARCEWTDITLLLTSGAFTDGARGKYHDESCEQRQESEERYWWMSDPLLSDEGNDRHTEHFARKTLVLLHQATDKDEHYDWRPDRNHEVFSELLIRYGWPTSAVWGGATVDIDHNNFVAPLRVDLKKRLFEPRMSPYSTMEYSIGRVHLAPKWDILKDVSKAETDDWELYAPQGPTSRADRNGETWWPEEHMRYKPALLIQIPDGQLGFWRRQHEVRVGMAIDITGMSATHLRPLVDSIATTSLVVSDGPHKNELLFANSAPYSGRLNVNGLMQSRPTLMAVEVVGSTTRANRSSSFAGRTRFGITPPLALDKLSADSLGISTPVFYEPFLDGALPKDVDEMLPEMLGTTAVDSGGKIGVFWESYGITKGDSIDFAVNIYHADAQSVLKRIASALKLGPPIGNVSIAWRDPELGVEGTAGDVPILARSITLDLSSLNIGNYWIEVSVKTPKRAPVVARRALRILYK